MEILRLVVELLLIILLIIVGSSVVYKDNFAVLNGNFDVVNGSGKAIISFPEGYNNENCVVISAGTSFSPTTAGSIDFGSYDTKHLGVRLASTITLNLKTTDNVGPTGKLNYKIVLMKI